MTEHILKNKTTKKKQLLKHPLEEKKTKVVEVVLKSNICQRQSGPLCAHAVITDILSYIFLFI